MSGATPPERTSLRLNAAKKAQGGKTPPPTNKKTMENPTITLVQSCRMKIQKRNDAVMVMSVNG